MFLIKKKRVMQKMRLKCSFQQKCKRSKLDILQHCASPIRRLLVVSFSISNAFNQGRKYFDADDTLCVFFR